MNFDRAWRTWNGRPVPAPSDEECRLACIQNAHEAAAKEPRAREELARVRRHIPIDKADQERIAAQIDHWSQELAKAIHEPAHWRRIAADFTAPRPRYERQPGEDDE